MKIHFIAIGGSAMHNLAIALHKKGHEVSGSDDEVFEPSKSRLAQHDLLPKEIGWQPEKITEEIDTVILGMHARPDNPELLAAQDLGIEVVSYPEYLFRESETKTRVAICGSHGKTTISAMILHVLGFHNKDCDFMIGAQLAGFDTMVKLTAENEFILLEGDEYLSSPIDLRPKFLHYKPNIALLSGIAWDHVNVFPDYESYYQQFELLLDTIEAGGAIIYNEEDKEVVKVVENTKNQIKKFGYGLPDYSVENGRAVLHTEEGDIPLQIFGKHNMNNLEGARWICNQMGVTDAEFYEAIPSFKGASRRLEPIFENGNITAFRDYAHAPSKVKATTEAVKDSHPDRKLVACLELHTFSSLSIDFIEQYRGTMQRADEALVYYNPKVVAHKKLPALSKTDVQEKFGEGKVQVFDHQDGFLKKVKKELRGEAVFLVMSSGSFDGMEWGRFLEENVQ